MLPTPSTKHINSSPIYPPAEDSFLLLDTLSVPAQTAFLSTRFKNPPTPLLLEVGTGSGVVLAFLAANAGAIFGREVLVLGTDVNGFASRATRETVEKACRESKAQKERTGGERGSVLLGTTCADLAGPLQRGVVDVLVFNPPYVPSPEVPDISSVEYQAAGSTASFDEESRLLEMSYAGGVDGMEVTQRLVDQLPVLLDPKRGVAYVLLCHQNKPEKVMQMIRNWGTGWKAEIVGTSGNKAGWEKLVILRVYRK
ncbi:S-adenosylmethionine-dependent methyltransferase [Puttea exsequens]|nr:S-adenosylmethionine-dependent methyltransferase [Puttea exsequens]